MAQVFLGMSGGVDSSAAAVLLQEQGYAVSGLHLSLLSGLPLPADRLPDDGSDARAVASLLGFPFYDMDLSPEFRATVIDYFIREYEAGRTPNPCVFCNRRIKFGAMWDAARKLGADYLATGHYAKIRQDPATGRHLLCRGADRSKDQSYFLCRLTQEQLSRTLFPLGDLEKPAVRALAEGRVLGQHKGFIRYTKGQHKGLGLAIEPPLYVLRKDPADHAVYLGHNEDLFTSELIAGDWNWISLPALTAPMTVTVKTRYSQREAEAVAEPLSGGQVRLRFREPQRAVTPGQFVVLYDGDTVVGGGVILE